MLYDLKVRALKIPGLNRLWRHWRARRGERVGHYEQLVDLIREYAPGRSFADIGCMWGVNGRFAFLAEDAGAARVAAVDVFGPTQEFERTHQAKRSRVEFILGDCTRPSTIDTIGPADVVLCAGVLYHHPSPFDLLVALRRICRGVLILRTSTIPEVPGLPNAAVFFPYLPEGARQRWNLRSLGVGHQEGLSGPFNPDAGYGNWFWGLSPSCVGSLVKLAGFDIERQMPEPFAHTIVARAVAEPLEHRLPDDPRGARGEGVRLRA